MKLRHAVMFAPALAALPLLAATSASAAAPASTGGTMYSATLTPVPLNGQTSAKADVMIMLNGSQATITEHASGLAATFMGAAFPHVQHIHGKGGMGACPTASADTNKDGVITTTEGEPSYGDIDTTLSTSGDTSPAAGTNVKTAPSGASFSYSRTITLDAQTLSDLTSGKASVVIHGLDPATAPKAATTEKSELVPSLPQAATAPALCGQLVASQMSSMPMGGVNTGGTPAGSTDTLPLALTGLGALMAAGGALALRRRSAARATN